MTEPTTPHVPAAAAAAVPAAWYPDPAGGPRQRWWDGTQWTEHFQDPYAGPGVALKAPEGTNINTPWVWLILVLPVLAYIPLLTIDWSTIFSGIRPDASGLSSMTATFALFFSPGYLIAITLSWIVYLVNALFAYFDWRELQRRGVPKPFHFAWVFLSSLVYVIGRSVVTKRRTGQGDATLWAAIGSIVLAFVIVGIMTAQMFAAIMQFVGTYSTY